MTQPAEEPSSYDLVVVGAGRPGLALAAEAVQAGIPRVVVLERSGEAPTEAVEGLPLRVQYGTAVTRIEPGPDHQLLITTDQHILHSPVCVVAELPPVSATPPPLAVPTGVAARVHTVWSDEVQRNNDVLVVGTGERAVAFVERLVALGARVVLSFPSASLPLLSSLSAQLLTELETDRRLTILWHATPGEIVDMGGLPMVLFDDRRTPDLVFDRLIYAPEHEASDPVAALGIQVEGEPSGLFVLHLRPTEASGPAIALAPAGAWDGVRYRHFAHLPSTPRHPPLADDVEELRRVNYNATIDYFDRARGDLWILRIRPDATDVTYQPGQYATLGVGAWEPRVDGLEDAASQNRRRVIRRSYSISSPVFDQSGYLVDPGHERDIELYLVLVRAEGSSLPELTPRLALFDVGDRCYLGPKIVGRYTLESVTDPFAPVAFLATGTGEAPHNAMITQLFRKGHQGPMISVVSVRYPEDLAYLEVNRELERRYRNYTYLPITTREPGVPKRYVQDLVKAGDLDAWLDPSKSHAFLCGNPAMIGLPKWDGEQPTFPDVLGVAQLLWERGFRIDHRGARGNVHYEEYW